MAPPTSISPPEVSPKAREAISKAAETGDLGSLKSLLPPTPSKELLSETLNRAIRFDKPEIFHYLVSLGATHNIHTAENAIVGGNLDTLKRLLDDGLSPNYPGGHVASPLEIAACLNKFDIAELLIECGAKVNPGSQENPLRTAAGEGSAEMVRFLLLKGARLAGSGALQQAAADGNINNIGYLLSLGVEIDNEEDYIWGTALYAAASCGKSEAVTYLLDEGANPSKRTGSPSLTPEEGALRLGHEDVAKMIREFKARK